jgi:hypothetical protein
MHQKPYHRKLFLIVKSFMVPNNAHFVILNSQLFTKPINKKSAKPMFCTPNYIAIYYLFLLITSFAAATMSSAVMWYFFFR